MGIPIISILVSFVQELEVCVKRADENGEILAAYAIMSSHVRPLPDPKAAELEAAAELKGAGEEGQLLRSLVLLKRRANRTVDGRGEKRVKRSAQDQRVRVCSLFPLRCARIWNNAPG